MLTRRRGLAVAAASLLAAAPLPARAASWTIYGPGNRYEGRMVEIPGGRTIERYGPGNQYEGRYVRTPNGWLAYGPGNRYEGRLQRQGGAARPDSPPFPPP